MCWRHKNEHLTDCNAQLALKLLFMRTFLTCTVGQVTWLLLYDQGLLVGLRTEDYKSLCVAATICATLVNIQTYRDSVMTSLYEYLRQMS